MYMYSRYSILIQLTLTAVIPSCLSNCPPEKYLPDCTCTESEFTSNEVRVQCAGISDPERFKKQVQALNTSCGATVRLENFDFEYFADGTFLGTNIKGLYLFDGKLRYFSRLPRPFTFTGIENSLKIFYAYQISELEVWDWNQFGILNELLFLLVQECPAKQSTRSIALYAVPLMRIVIRNSNFSTVAVGTFSSASNMSILDLGGNRISSFERQHLPQHAPYLTFINMRNNHLVYLNSDTFEDLPALSYLDLSSNLLSTLPELLYYPVWHHLNVVFISGNPVECDSRLAWLLKSDSRHGKMTDVNRLSCHSPPRLAGRALGDLYESDLDVDQDVD